MQNTVFYTCRRPFGSGGQSRSSAPASSRRRGGAGGRAPLVRGEGGEWRARVRSGGGPSAGAAGLEFPSKGIRREFWNSLRREFEGNSKGAGSITRRVGHILQPSLSVTENRLRVPFDGALRRNSKRHGRRRVHSRRRRRRTACRLQRRACCESRGARARHVRVDSADAAA